MTSSPLILNKVLVPKEFNKVASSYDFATKLSQGYQDDLDTSVQRMELKGNEKLLDLCCGTGKSTLACLKQLPSGCIIGVDNSEGMLKEAKHKFAEEIKSGKICFLLQDAMNLDFPDNSFDAVFMAYGLRNMPDYQKSIRGIYRILKPNGKLCIHDYSLSKNIFTKAYWFILGYGFIVPLCTFLSRSSKIYTYLIKSVLTFLSPNEIKFLLINNGFESVLAQSHSSWRKPILYSIIGTKRA